MKRKINSQIAFSLVLLAALAAVFVMVLAEQYSLIKFKSNRGFPDDSSVVMVKHEEKPKTKIVRNEYDFQKYRVNLKITLAAKIVGNDYGDGLMQFTIQERTNPDGMIAYDGGFPTVGIRVSDSCNGNDISTLCQQFDKLMALQDPQWKALEKDGKKIVERKNVLALADDYFDNFYLKKDNKVISVYYKYPPHAVYVLDGVDKKTLPRLPYKLDEEKRMQAWMRDLVSQLEK